MTTKTGQPRDEAPPGSAAADFYDQLAPYYHLIFEDWQASIDRQGQALDAIVQAEWPAARTVHDAAAGIGTQALGLLARGYRVTASDVSARALARARREAEQRGFALPTVVADLRTLSAALHESAPPDLILACDNSLPHLLSEEEISRALGECHRSLRPGGGCLFSVRDYGGGPPAAEPASELRPYGVRRTRRGRTVLFQIWEWHGPRYEMSFYVLEDEPGTPPRTQVFRTWYFAISPDRLLALMTATGFEKVRRIDEGFYQPVLVGTKPGG